MCWKHTCCVFYESMKPAAIQHSLKFFLKSPRVLLLFMLVQLAGNCSFGTSECKDKCKQPQQLQSAALVDLLGGMEEMQGSSSSKCLGLEEEALLLPQLWGGDKDWPEWTVELHGCYINPEWAPTWTRVLLTFQWAQRVDEDDVASVDICGACMATSGHV